MASASPSDAPVPVVDERYCVKAPKTLKATEIRYSSKFGSDYLVRDVTTTICGDVLFWHYAAEPFNTRSRKLFLDADREPLLFLQRRKRLGGLRSAAWQLFRGDGFVHEICEARPTLLPRGLDVYLRGNRSGTPNFKARGGAVQKHFQVTQVLHGGAERPIASVERYSRFTGPMAYMREQHSADGWVIQLQPGADEAFVTALTLVFDEVYGWPHLPS